MSGIRMVRPSSAACAADTGFYWYMAGKQAAGREAAMESARRAKTDGQDFAICGWVRIARRRHRESLDYIRRAVSQ